MPVSYCCIDVADLFSGSDNCEQFSWLATLTLLTVGRSSKSVYRYPTAVSRRFEFVHRLVNQYRREVQIICRWPFLLHQLTAPRGKYLEVWRLMPCADSHRPYRLSN